MRTIDFDYTRSTPWYSLEDPGWSPFFDQQTEQLNGDGLTPMRVAEEQRGAYVLWSADGTFEAVIPGRMRHEADGRDYLPAVSDWLLARPLPGEPRRRRARAGTALGALAQSPPASAPTGG